MLMNKPRHRIFDYIPRYYNPENDEQEKRKKHLGFQRQRKLAVRKKNPLRWAILVLLIIYIILKLQGII